MSFRESQADGRGDALGPEPAEVKSCCARLYESDFVRLLLGESFHPGGLKLTSRLGEVLGLSPSLRVLDIACGKGASAIHICETFGCEIIGIDYSAENVSQANRLALQHELRPCPRFVHGDSERLPFEDASFDAVVCECAFCTFPGKPAAAGEFFRVLRPGGRVGLSDITRVRDLPSELETLMAWVACIADAQPVEDYAGLLTCAGFHIECMENHDEALKEMTQRIRMKLLGLEIAMGLGKLALPGFDPTAARQLSAAALQAVSQGQLGYAIVSATKPS